jgi:hypothetical protein
LDWILVGGDQLGVSLISELDPWPPVMCALTYSGLSAPSMMA